MVLVSRVDSRGLDRGTAFSGMVREGHRPRRAEAPVTSPALDTCESGGRALRIGLREFGGPKVGLPDRDLGHSRRLCPRSAREADTVPLLVLLVNTRSVLAPPGLSQTGLPTQRR